MQIIKASGEAEKFNHEKFCNSLEQAGANPSVAQEVCKRVKTEIGPSASTDEIFEKATALLQRKDIGIVMRYSLKRGVAALGPAGFHFEQYVETIVNAYGYKTKRNVFMKGVCVTHEVDVVAQKGRKHFLIEAKYRNRQGIKTDITTTMYADARLQDIIPVQEKKEKGWGAMHSMWLITNTKFTKTAIKYGKCKNMEMTGWNYPTEESLQNLITRKGLYPVTVLPSVAKQELNLFAQAGIILARDLLSFSSDSLKKEIGIQKQKADKILGEAYLSSVDSKKE
ncbi:hypothetical protein CL630_00040 [bacterium]|nr:hypothetical protein [bacterium]